MSVCSIVSSASMCSSMDEAASTSLVGYSNSSSNGSCKNSASRKPADAPYKNSRRYCCRRSESMLLSEKHPDKVPLIIERFTSEKKLRPLEKCQFVLPAFATVGQLQHVIRQRVCDGRLTVYILAGCSEIPSLDTTIGELADRHRDSDGFTYLKYTSEDCLG